MLDHKPQGELAELCFLCRATTLGLTVSKPYGDSARYDFVVDAGGGLLRVQVKSVSLMRRNDYRIAASSGSRLKRGYSAAEIDFRLFGMLLALVAILIGFNVVNEGTFLRPTNMTTLAVQGAGVAVLATGMVLVIVARNIDLSVGSLVGFIAMSYALLMTDRYPPFRLDMGGAEPVPSDPVTMPQPVPPQPAPPQPVG